jgi:hypothetical protein
MRWPLSGIGRWANVASANAHRAGGGGKLYRADEEAAVVDVTVVEAMEGNVAAASMSTVRVLVAVLPQVSVAT